jgi:hypothetical protein
MNIRYRVELNEAERLQLTALLSGGTRAAGKLKRAQILLAADARIGDEAIAGSISVGRSMVYRDRASHRRGSGLSVIAASGRADRAGRAVRRPAG